MRQTAGAGRSYRKTFVGRNFQILFSCNFGITIFSIVFFSNVGMRSVPNTLPSLKFPNFGNASCCPCFSCFSLFFLQKKKRRKSGKKLFDTNGPESCSPLCNATIHINSFSIETILCRCFVRAPGWIGCVITYNRGIF